MIEKNWAKKADDENTTSKLKILARVYFVTQATLQIVHVAFCDRLLMLELFEQSKNCQRGISSKEPAKKKMRNQTKNGFEHSITT